MPTNPSQALSRIATSWNSFRIFLSKDLSSHLLHLVQIHVTSTSVANMPGSLIFLNGRSLKQRTMASSEKIFLEAASISRSMYIGEPVLISAAKKLHYSNHSKARGAIRVSNLLS